MRPSLDPANHPSRLGKGIVTDGVPSYMIYALRIPTKNPDINAGADTKSQNNQRNLDGDFDRLVMPSIARFQSGLNQQLYITNEDLLKIFNIFGLVSILR